MKVKKVGIIINDANDSWEGMRSLFGLLTENFWCYLFMVDAPVLLPPEMTEDEFVEHLEMFVEDMEAEFYTTVEADAAKYENLALLSLEEMAPKMRDCELLIPF